MEECVILLDDDVEYGTSLKRVILSSGFPHDLQVASSEQELKSILHSRRPLSVVLDLHLNEAQGVEAGFSVLKMLTREAPYCRVVVLTGHGSTEHGIRAISLGAANFLQKPVEIPHLIALLKDAVEQAHLRLQLQKLLEDQAAPIAGVVGGKAPLMKGVLEKIRHASRTNQPVLILGETGTGKGVCAKAIHDGSIRAHKAFVRYQPHFVSSDLVNSELFGHKKGSFTGATEDRRGLLLEAHGGTLFLDEIDELPHDTQVTLLGVLQDKVFRPVGANEERQSDFRIICATNRPVAESLKSGKLRADLYHRISHFQIHLPPLRDRLEDLPELAAALLGRISRREGFGVFAIDSDALLALRGQQWGGNVRELEGVLESAAWNASFSRRPCVTKEDLSLVLSPGERREENVTFHELVEEYKRGLVEKALAETGGNQLQAAKLLGMDRTSFRRILARS